MKILEYSVKTTIVNSDDGRNYEIVREVSGDGIKGNKEMVLITICPSISAQGGLKLDSTASHLLNHMNELGVNRVSVINLFSKITDSRLSCRNLAVDEDNMKFLEAKMKEKRFKDALFVIGWGSSMKSSDAANLSRKKVIQLYKKHCPKNTIYRLASDSLKSEEPIHPLRLGIYTKNSKWRLEEYVPPIEIISYTSPKKEIKENVLQNNELA